MALKNHVG